jgi:hypothetical protein
MGETNPSDFCDGTLIVQDFNMTKIEVNVVSEFQINPSSKAMRKIANRLANRNGGPCNREKKLRKIMKELIFLLGRVSILGVKLLLSFSVWLFPGV